MHYLIRILIKIEWILFLVKNINAKCFIPQETDNYLTNLRATQIANIDAITYLKNKGHDIGMVDSEHYDTPTHEKIAKEYIPYIKETQWKTITTE